MRDHGNQRQQIGDATGCGHPETAMVAVDWSVSRPQQRPRHDDEADVALTGGGHQMRSPAKPMATTASSYRTSLNLQA